MFIKTIVKTDKNTGKRYNYYRLCQSYRIGVKTRHRTIITLGKLEGLSKGEFKQLVDCIEYQIYGDLFGMDFPEHILTLGQGFYNQIVEKRKRETVQDITSTEKPVLEKDFQHIDLNSLSHDTVRELGSEWLCKQAIGQLGLSSFLSTQGFNDEEVNLSISHLISRAVYPVSEHKTALWMKENSSVLELMNVNSHRLNHTKLYHISHRLYGKKTELEHFLSKQTNELFDLEDKIILYDLTNTYFEGRKQGSSIAKFGRSKEKRSDAKLIVLALVTNSEGFVKYSRICKGNLSDPKSLKETVDDISASAYSSAKASKPILVFDAGIATKDNLEMLREEGWEYLCVNRTKLKDYICEKSNQTPTILHDNKGNTIEVLSVKMPEDTDKYLYVRSEQKAVKEASMDDHFSQRYEEELDSVIAGIHKKGGTKKTERVWERIGRIKERYSTANKHYNIKVQAENGKVVHMEYSRKTTKTQTKQSHGVYFLRTNIKSIEDNTFWRIYNTLTEIEATFRVLKTDLNIRPVYHKNDDSIMAHLFLAVLAYMVVHTVRHQLKAKGINYDWKNIIRIMSTQKLVTTSMKNDEEQKIIVHKCSTPSAECAKIYRALAYKQFPFRQKKFVLPE